MSAVSAVMSEHVALLVRAVAECDMARARAYAKCVLADDTSKKNAWTVKGLMPKLEGSGAAMEIPSNLSGILHVEDVSGFAEHRHYLLSEREEAVLGRVGEMRSVSGRLYAAGLPYANAVLLTGPSGSGKTMFARASAERLGLPFAYVPLESAVSSYMGRTSQTLGRVFDWAEAAGAFLMLDEVDAITLDRRSANLGEGAVQERGHMTTTLMQRLDSLPPSVVLFAATNVPDRLDPALVRRFAIRHEVEPLDAGEKAALGERILDGLGIADAGLRRAVRNRARLDEATAGFVSAIARAVAKAAADGSIELDGGAR